MQFFRHIHIFGFLCVAAAILFVWSYFGINSIPPHFPVGGSFVVEEDESIRSVSARLEDGGFINSAFLFRAWVSFFGHDKSVQLGGYQFNEKYSLQGLVNKLVYERPDLPLVKVTFPEGSTTEEMAQLLHVALPAIATSTFVAEVLKQSAHGVLFPSTYFLLPSTNESRAITIFRDTFESKYKKEFALAEIPEVLKNRNEIITLASILEGEAQSDVDKRMVAGILLKRMEKKMPLQVDVAMETYKTKGLPQSPINNPGIASIKAVFNPIQSQYLFYITGNDGKMYYAKTFEEHKRNIVKYLK